MNRQTDLAVVFDLDGTLVNTGSFDGPLFIEAIRDVIGYVEIDRSWQRYRHVTDRGVLMQILEEHGISSTDEIMGEVRDLFGASVRRHLEGGASCEAIPGAKVTIERLRTRGYKVGIATGGWGHTARMKLRRAGISFEDLALTSSDDSFDRVEIMTTCLKQLRGTPDRAIYIGDGLWDQEASRRAGWEFIGIGEKLRGQCEPWIADFTDPSWRLAEGNAWERSRET